MPMPYSRIRSIRVNPTAIASSFLLATSGPTLLVSDVRSGEIVSVWTSPKDVVSQDGQERPTKKQKIETPANLPNIIDLTTNEASGKVAVVTDDKVIHVLSLDEHGVITEGSRRLMPKRPCALHISAQDQSLIVADKFGDVYSMPLSPDPKEDARFASAEAAARQQQQAFKPSATELTVHTQRNLKALESQQKQKKFTERKESLAFQHKLILGHVSMLTDMAFVSSPGSHTRIITADRDEHVRISRAPPQAHVIEGYCMGHTQYISKLCPIPSTTLFASGGGDDWLSIWDWTTCELKSKIDLKQAILDAGVATTDKLEHIAILRLAHITSSPAHTLLVFCERVRAVITIILHTSLQPEVLVERTEHSPIDMTQDRERIIISFDARQHGAKRLLEYERPGHALRPRLTLVNDLQPAVLQLNSHETESLEDEDIDSLVYCVAQLRKRVDWSEAAQEGDAAGEEQEAEVEGEVNGEA